MLLKCSECGFDNQLGAIFCRECGAKLDVEKMRPQVKEKKIKFSFGDLARNLLAIAVLGGLAFSIAMMFYPEHALSTGLETTEQEQTDIKFQSLINKIAGEPEEDTYTFTPDEVTYLYNNKLIESKEGTGYEIDKMHFSLDPNNNVILLLNTKMMGGMNVSFKIIGRIVDEKADLEVISAKMGHLSIPGFVQDKIIAQFTPAINEGSIKDIIAATEKLTINDDGAFQITVKELKK